MFEIASQVERAWRGVKDKPRMLRAMGRLELKLKAALEAQVKSEVLEDTPAQSATLEERIEYHIDTIRRLAEEGKSSYAIARAVGISRKHLALALQKHGIDTAHIKLLKARGIYKCLKAPTPTKTPARIMLDNNRERVLKMKEFMTLAEVARALDVPLTLLKSALEAWREGK